MDHKRTQDGENDQHTDYHKVFILLIINKFSTKCEFLIKLISFLLFFSLRLFDL